MKPSTSTILVFAAVLATAALLYFVAARQHMQTRDPLLFIAVVAIGAGMVTAAFWFHLRRCFPAHESRAGTEDKFDAT